MRVPTLLVLSLGFLFLAGCGGGGGGGVPPAAAVPRAARTASFVHTATELNTSDDITYLDHALANGRPLAVLIVTPNWNPVDGGPMIWFDHSHAVAYDATIGQWGIVTGDGTSIPADASFNVTVATDELNGSVALFRHAAIGSTIDGLVSRIDHVMANNQPDALVFCTRNLTPPGGMAPADTVSFSVSYHLSDSQWALHNQDGTAIQVGSAFNVAIMRAGGGGPFSSAWIHQSSVDDTEFNFTYLGAAYPRDAIIHAMPFQCGLRGYPTAHGQHFNGVWYDESSGAQWGVFNQDIDDMVMGVAFHMAVCTP